jgi:hypothetical protein
MSARRIRTVFVFVALAALVPLVAQVPTSGGPPLQPAAGSSQSPSSQAGTQQGQSPQNPPEGNAPTQAQAQPEKPQSPPPKGLQWQIGEYTVKLGGYIKVDLIHDFDEIGSTDSFDPRTIPTDDEVDPGTNTRMHARQTRLNLDVRGPTDIGPLRMFVEGDFFGDGNAFRLRHAYGQVAGVLGGQTWSTFMDEDAMPETLDFESPIAFPLVRQAMIRYTHDLCDGSYAAIALEDPASKVIAPPVAGETEEATPDLTGRLRWKHGLGHTQLGLFAGTARYVPDTAPDQTVFLWGLNVSTKLDVCEHDHAFVQLTYGPGVGRYRGGITAAPDASGDLEAVTVFGAMVGYEHHWCDELRSTVSYSWGKGDLPDGVPADTSEILEYLAANVIWQFCDRAWFGIEYLYGSNETFDGARGEAHRLQASIRFDF